MREALPTITRIRPLTRDPNLRSVLVEGRRVATLTAAQVEALALEAGMQWTQELENCVAAMEREAAARRDALRMLGRREHSAGALREGLAAKGHDAESIDRTLAELAEQGWLDDARVATATVNDAIRAAPRSAVEVESKLKRQKIDDAVIETTLERFRSEHDEQHDAFELARARLRRTEGLDPQTRLHRISNLLARRGFNEDAVEHVIETLARELGIDHERP